MSKSCNQCLFNVMGFKFIQLLIFDFNVIMYEMELVNRLYRHTGKVHFISCGEVPKLPSSRVLAL